MVPGGVTEVLWHFVGHLRIIEDIARDRAAYDEGALSKQLNDYTAGRPDFDSNPSLDEFSTSPLQVSPVESLEDHLDNKVRALKALIEPPSDEDMGLPARLLPPPVYFAGGGAGGGSSFHITAVYEPGGEQSEIHIQQANFMLDNDMTGIAPEFMTPAFLSQVSEFNLQAEKLLEKMADDANQQIPKEWWIPKDEAGITGFLQQFEKGQVDSGGAPDAHSVTSGYYLNGELQSPSPDPPAPLLGDMPTHDTGKGLGVWTEAGGNNSFNGALIVDLSESGRTMIVMGDYFHTNAIFQTNSIMDHDHVSGAGSDSSAILKGQDTTDNIADFIQHPGVFSTVAATFAGPQWHVDVVHGDYYNIQTTVQMNYLMDNDIVVQQGGSNHYDIIAGENEQGNLAQLFDGSIHYDLIIVAGAYHGMNVIFQNNILLNNDYIKQLGDDSGASQSVGSGQNELLNAATIESYGNDEFAPMTAKLAGLVGAVADGTTSLDPELGTLVPGSGGTFNILYITGDYYDVNAIWQTNVTSDVNVLLQLMNAPSAAALQLHPNDDGTMSASTGGNSLTNDAAIVDVGPTNAYVGGQVYGDTILVQANLVPTEGDHALNKDAHALVPELIAFVDESQGEAPSALPLPPPPPHDDAMANIMH